jgi:tungstate transport system ATP-binding protein
MNPLLAVAGLRKSNDGRVLLDIDRFSLERGSTYVLQGDNGSGKTTLLRILAGFATADAGTITFDGVRYDIASERIRLAPRMIYVHQHSYVFHTGVAENIEYGLKLQGIRRGERERLVKAEMEWAGIAHLSAVPSHRLSGGEKQRVALARARILKPEMLLLDEPTANLDDDAREQVVALIQQMRDDNNCVVIATHDRAMMALNGATHWRLGQGHLQCNFRKSEI